MSGVQMSVTADLKRKTNPAFLEKAQAADHHLHEQMIHPVSAVRIQPSDDGTISVVREKDPNGWRSRPMRRGDSLCLDFGNHHVGYLKLSMRAVGSPQDAPALLRLKFAEIPQELLDDSGSYNGWLSTGWIQEEYLHADVLPQEMALTRRYAFRYLEICVIDTSQKYQLVVEDAALCAVSSADPEAVRTIDTLPADLQAIDRISLKTLQDCMQHEFEDGPKRDRRLWLGDLMLQARTNYRTFRNYDLVKRCLYLFAASTREDGKIAACLFTQPIVQCDDTFLWDYSLFFITVLYDYYMETKDRETLMDLWPSAYRQIELACDEMEGGILRESDGVMTAFIDWKEGLERQAAAQGIFIYVLRQAEVLADVTGRQQEADAIRLLREEACEKAISAFWDEGRKCFVSGASRQASKISQAWMVLADVMTGEDARELMLRTLDDENMLDVLTPYAYHFLTEAMLHVGEKDRALEMICSYWGAMANLGADTFWEMFDPEEPSASVYGSRQVNSFCHAWSCTPAWLLREYYEIS